MGNFFSDIFKGVGDVFLGSPEQTSQATSGQAQYEWGLPPSSQYQKFPLELLQKLLTAGGPTYDPQKSALPYQQAGGSLEAALRTPTTEQLRPVDAYGWMGFTPTSQQLSPITDLAKAVQSMGAPSQYNAFQQPIGGQPPQYNAFQQNIGGQPGPFTEQLLGGQLHDPLKSSLSTALEQYTAPWQSPVAQGQFGAVKNMLDATMEQNIKPAITSTGAKYGLTGSSGIAREMGNATTNYQNTLSKAMADIMGQQQQVGQQQLLSGTGTLSSGAGTAGQLELGGGGLDLSKVLGLGGLDLSSRLGTGQLDLSKVLGLGGLNLSTMLGTGQLDLSKLLGMGQLDLSRVLGGEQLDLSKMLGLSNIDLSRTLGGQQMDLSKILALSNMGNTQFQNQLQSWQSPLAIALGMAGAAPRPVQTGVSQTGTVSGTNKPAQEGMLGGILPDFLSGIFK